MKNNIIEDLNPQGSKAWLNVRLGFMTGSDNPLKQNGELKSTWKDYSNKKAVELVYKYTRNEALKKEIDFTDFKEDFKTPLMERGNRLEAITVVEYKKLFPNDIVIERGFIYNPALLVGVSVDREGINTLGEHYLIEIKNPKLSTFLGYAKDPNSLKRRYYTQTQLQLYIMGLDLVKLVAHYPQHELIIVDVIRDDKFIANLEKSLKQYKDYTLSLLQAQRSLLKK